MVDMIVPPALAEKIRQIAAREQRPVEDVLNKMVEQYAPQPEPSPAELFDYLRQMPGIIAPPENPAPPPFSEEELAEIAKKAGASGPLSADIIEQRKQGW